MTANAATRLLQHYVDNSRDLPWRKVAPNGRPDPYRVWLSEIMLQQTTVATVTKKFERFIERWPTLRDLAAAEDSEVMSEWAGLGYYARARNLIACARSVADRGFPTAAAELRKLPGIGDYTSAAIAAIAFGEDAAPVDTNVSRVIARLDGIVEPKRTQIERRFLDICPPGRAGDLAQAMMDLGATICRPRKPDCEHCPLHADCVAHASGTPELIPVRKAKKDRPHRFGIAHWIAEGGRVWLVRRPERGILGGMTALPGPEWTDDDPRPSSSLGAVSHQFTHFALTLHVVRRSSAEGEGFWQETAAIADAGLPTLYRRAAELALAMSGRPSANHSTRLEVGEATP